MHFLFCQCFYKYIEDNNRKEEIYGKGFNFNAGRIFITNR